MHKPTCLFIGRFQPFHKGHLLVVQGMSKVCGKTILVIGSTDKKGPDDPFSYEERRDMIQRTLQTEDIIPRCDVEFLEMRDLPSDEEWTKQLLEKTGPVDIVWTGNEDTKKCFEGKVPEIKMIKEVPGISATEVRARMRGGGDWKALVPPEIIATMNAIDGVKKVVG